MKRDCKKKRYVYDPLYGIIYLPEFIWDVLDCPEIQRLREVRLCNINSLCLTGGANINRYEHAIGTYYLAKECLDSRPPLHPVGEKEQKLFLLAALLHDVASAAFGHSVEYIESKQGFEHEKAFEYVVLGERGEAYEYKRATLEPIFFGLPREIRSKIGENDLETIDKLIAGKSRLGPLINSTMDLDNIDNVYRLGYHIGIVKSGEIPLKLAKSLYIENDALILKKEAVPLVEEWHELRKKLYLLLLLNPEEFSAKCMLTEAIELAKTKSVHPFDWYDVDYKLLEKLSDISSESAIVVSRLMKGDLYGCIAIFSTAKTDNYGFFTDTNSRKQLEDDLNKRIRSKFSPRFKSSLVATHPIIDVNKTERQVRIQTDDGKIAQIGTSSNRLLIAVFFKNVDLNMYRICEISSDVMSGIRREIHTYLSNFLGDPNLGEVDLYGEVQSVR